MNARRAARNAWAERYLVTSTRGRVYTRPMLRAYVMQRAPLYLRDKHVDAVLDDERFMTWHRGMVPQAVSKAIIDEAGARQFGIATPFHGTPPKRRIVRPRGRALTRD